MTAAQDFWQLVQRTVFDPATAAREIVAMNLSRSTLWQALVLAVLLNTFVAMVLLGEGFEVAVAPGLSLTFTPVSYTLVQGASAVIMIFAVHYTGLALGGQARMGETLATIVWFQYVLLVFRGVLTLVLFVNTAIAGAVGLAMLVCQIWIFVTFVTETQRFESRWRGAGVLVAAAVMLAFGVVVITSIIMGLTGFEPPIGEF